MNRAWLSLLGFSLLLNLGFTACSTNAKRPALSSQEAMNLAVQLANHQAMRLFNITPFNTNRAELTRVADRWTWQTLAGWGKADLFGKVSFREDGSDPQVTVEMFTSYPMRPVPAD